MSAAANSLMGANGTAINHGEFSVLGMKTKAAAYQQPLSSDYMFQQRSNVITDVALVIESSASSRLSHGNWHSMAASSSGATTGNALCMPMLQHIPSSLTLALFAIYRHMSQKCGGARKRRPHNKSSGGLSLRPGLTSRQALLTHLTTLRC